MWFEKGVKMSMGLWAIERERSKSGNNPYGWSASDKIKERTCIELKLNWFYYFIRKKTPFGLNACVGLMDGKLYSNTFPDEKKMLNKQQLQRQHVYSQLSANDVINSWWKGKFSYSTTLCTISFCICFITGTHHSQFFITFLFASFCFCSDLFHSTSRPVPVIISYCV